MQFAKALCLLLCLLPTLSAETEPTPTAPDNNIPTLSHPRLIIGKIVWVDTEQAIAVAWMQSRYLALHAPVSSRGKDVSTNAKLEPSRYRNGRSYGLNIVNGTPEVGDDIVQ